MALRLLIRTPYPRFRGRSVFERGIHTLSVSVELHAVNRKRLVEKLRQVTALTGKRAVVVLQGGAAETRHCTDHEVRN